MPDPATPVVETLAALHELVVAGKVRYLGHSNFAGWRLAEAEHVARENGLTPFVCAQNSWSLLDREVEREVVPAAGHYGLGVLPYYPLESGLLTGKYRRGEDPPPDSRFVGNPSVWPAERWLTDEAFDAVEALESFAAERGISLLDLAIGGLAAMPAVGSVIAGATTPAQVRANARAAEWQPSDADLAALRALA